MGETGVKLEVEGKPGSRPFKCKAKSRTKGRLESRTEKKPETWTKKAEDKPRGDRLENKLEGKEWLE